MAIVPKVYVFFPNPQEYMFSDHFEDVEAENDPLVENSAVHVFRSIEDAVAFFKARGGTGWASMLADNEKCSSSYLTSHPPDPGHYQDTDVTPPPRITNAIIKKAIKTVEKGVPSSDDLMSALLKSIVDKKSEELSPSPQESPAVADKTPVPSDAAKFGASLTTESIQVSRDQRIHLPLPLAGDLPEAAKTLLKIDQEAKKTVAFSRKFPGFHPGDVGVNFMRLLKEIFGFVSLDGSMTFFGPKPPLLYQIPTSLTSTEPMVFGDISVPGMGDSISMKISIDFSGRMPSLVIGGECQSRHRAVVDGFLDRLQSEMPKRSIYRGAAVKVSWQWQRDRAAGKPVNYDVVDHAPHFLDLTRSSFNKIVFSAETERQVAANLFLPIIHGERWLEHGFPAKTGVLMQGPPGCGKTETLLQVAHLCVQNSRTYIQCESVLDLQLATHMALQYQPSVVSVEDIDKAVTGRDEDVDRLLNIIDGTEAKGRRIIFVATTNSVESITEAMLRPGRLGDGFIHMGPPDAAACERLVRLTCGESLAENADITSVCQAMADAHAIPAVIVATAQSACKYALVRTGMTNSLISPRDLQDAFRERNGQLELLTPPETDFRSEMEKAAEILVDGFRDHSLDATDA